MNERFVKSWASTILGTLMVIFAGVLLFVETHIEINGLWIAVIGLLGIMLVFAKDTVIDLIAKWASKKFSGE